MKPLAVLAVLAPLSLMPVSGLAQPPRGRVIATRLFTVADDFIVDVYHNGVKVPDKQRTLLHEVFGTTAERIDIEVREGDWVVFNVVNNRLRWGGTCYFGVAGRGDSGVAFTTSPGDPRWSCCDDTGKVSEFIADRDYLARNPVQAPRNAWSDGDGLLNSVADGWTGKPVWGQSRNTWIKFVARP